MSILDPARLRAFLPEAARAEEWSEALAQAMDRFEIITVDRIAAFLAQVAHESAGLARLVEGLNYSARGLMKTWPKRFPNLEKALSYERQPEKLANYVYARRLGNGDEKSGDGWRFRGRGLLQITGRGNYRSCGQALGLTLEDSPEVLETPQLAALSAAQFWQSRGLNELADDRNDDNDDADFRSICLIINGGRQGLDARRALWKKAKEALT